MVGVTVTVLAVRGTAHVLCIKVLLCCSGTQSLFTATITGSI